MPLARWVGLVAVIGACGLGACGLVPSETFDDDAVLPQEVRSVRLNSESGGVTVTGRDGATGASVHRSVTYRGQRPQGATFRVDGDVLVLQGCGRNCSVHYQVTVPAGIPVRGRTSNGSISLSGTGPVDVRTSSGRIDLDGIAGDVRAKTSNGRIEGRTLRGAGVDVETSNGLIALILDTPQRVRASTSNGEISLVVPRGGYRVSADTSNGDEKIRLAQDPAGLPLDLSTSNGDITVLAR